MALAIDKDVKLGPFVLNHIYKGMNDLTFMDGAKLSCITRGHIWMGQIWFASYCPVKSTTQIVTRQFGLF